MKQSRAKETKFGLSAKLTPVYNYLLLNYFRKCTEAYTTYLSGCLGPKDYTCGDFH